MGFGSSASNLGHKLGPCFLLGHLRVDVTRESCVQNPTITWSEICFFVRVSGSVSEISGERGQRGRGERIKH